MKRIQRAFKEWFIPHKGNDHKPHILRPRTVALVCVIVLCGEFTMLAGITPFASRLHLFGVILVNALTMETNAVRITNNVPALTESPILQVAAQAKANDMVANNYFAHTSPTGITPWYWFAKFGYNFVYAGENLAINFSDSQDVTNAWMNSPGHRANILNSGFTQIGIAMAQGTYQGRPAVYVVELFGTPAVTTTILTVPSIPPHQTNVASAPAIAGSSNPTPSSDLFAVVKGARTQTSPSAVAVQANQTASVQIQNVIANPRVILNIVYGAIAVIFSIALLIAVLSRIHIRHPLLIASGAAAIFVTAGLLIVNGQLLFAIVK